MFISLIFAALLFLACLLALLNGGRDERWAAAIMVAASLLSPLVQLSNFLSPEVGIFAIDIMLLLALGQIAMLSDRYWPLAAVAFHINTVVMHAIQMLFPDVSGFVYADVAVFWAFPVLISLIAGLAIENRKSAQ